LKIVTPAKPMPSNMRIEPPRQPRSIALADLPNKLVTEFDKLKLHIEGHRAVIDTALEARGITVTDDEARQFLQVHADRDQIPLELFQKAMKLTPMGQQFLQAARQQLALVKYSGQTTEPTEQELHDAYQLAQAGRVACRQLSFVDKAKANEVAHALHANPERFEEIAAKHGQPNSFPSRTLIPTIPPNPEDEVLAKLKDGEVSDVIQVGDQFTIYQRQQLYKPPGTFEQLKPQLRATLILNKTNEIGQREVEQLRKAYRLIVVPVGTASAANTPGG
jgi:parvulin-like peptidyl-prolyl isomerase